MPKESAKMGESQSTPLIRLSEKALHPSFCPPIKPAPRQDGKQGFRVDKVQNDCRRKECGIRAVKNGENGDAPQLPVRNSKSQIDGSKAGI